VPVSEKRAKEEIARGRLVVDSLPDDSEVTT
jgi:hypothetical protein